MKKQETLKLSVIIPVFNEIPIIREIIYRVMQSPLVGEIFIVDDGSTDGTGEILAEYRNHKKYESSSMRSTRGRAWLCAPEFNT
jgi:glycosyltransferase involved in cell wall biosynthesis